MNDFQYLHSFQRLARDGKTNAFNDTCGSPFGVLKNKSGEPILWCPTCDSYKSPGLHMMDNVKRTVDYYVSVGYFQGE
jgi:hypothetical protein